MEAETCLNVFFLANRHIKIYETKSMRNRIIRNPAFQRCLHISGNHKDIAFVIVLALKLGIASVYTVETKYKNLHHVALRTIMLLAHFFSYNFSKICLFND